MTAKEDFNNFFTKLSKVWQNFNGYNFLKGINLSPEQIKIIEHEEEQLLIEGFAGTGKSITLLYKFINTIIRENENRRILYVTFNDTLIEDTKKRLKQCKEFNENKDRHYVMVVTFHQMASELLKTLKIIDKGLNKLTVERINNYRGICYRRIQAILSKYKDITSPTYKALPREERLYKTHDGNFITDEILWMKANGLVIQEKYLNTKRIGRTQSIRLTNSQKNTVFKVFQEYEEQLKWKYQNHLDLEDYALKIIDNCYMIDEKYKFDYIFVDEVQDLDSMQLKALCLLVNKSIVLSGDSKQKIYKKSPLTYEKIGLNIREKGKHKILNKNYRSTAQIVKLANSLKFADVENKYEEKLFVTEGERPIIASFKDQKSAVNYVASEINKIFQEDNSQSIAIIHREELKKQTGYKSNTRLLLEQKTFTGFSDINNYSRRFEHLGKKQIFYTNAYDVKGLEFDVVFILDFNKRYYPNLKEIYKVKEKNEDKDEELVDKDIEDIINTEKKLLYVAMTRAKNKLYLIANGCEKEAHISKFIFDFDSKNYRNKGFVKKDIEKFKAVLG